MWIFCCGMIRSGSTLQYQLTAEIVEKLGNGKRLGFVNNESFKELQKKEDPEKEMLVVKSHYFLQGANNCIKEGRGKAVYVYRDVRDVVPSFMNVSGASFGASVFAMEKSLNEYKKWVNTEDILISKYEELVEDVKREVGRITEYLGLTLDDSIADEIAMKFSLQEQKKRIKQTNYKKIDEEIGRENAPEPHSLLKKNHINSGESGQWNVALSRFQIGMIESIAYDWLKEKGYPISQNAFWRYSSNIFYRVVLKNLVKLQKKDV